jgi:parallel beta-helix repeat protein
MSLFRNRRQGEERLRPAWVVVLATAAVAITLAGGTAILVRTAASQTAPQTHRAAAATAASQSATSGSGYWLAASDGGIFSFGNARFHGSTGNVHLNQPIVGMAPTPSGGGYWLVASDGGIFAFGNARFHGSTGNVHLNQPIVGMAPTPSGEGYWLVASDGGIFAFGDARFHGSTGNVHLNRPIVDMAPTRDGRGYWLVASDGGIFAFGDARFHGSTGGITLNKPVVGIARTASGNGYWLVASDGGIFAFGDARFHGSTGGITLNKPVVGIARTASGSGYWLVASDGGIFALGDARFHGSTGNVHLSQPIVSLAPAGATSQLGVGPAPAPLPASAPVTWCETGLPISPYRTAPAGAVTVPAGVDSPGIAQNWTIKANTTYWLAPGTHTLGTGPYSQIQPQNGDVFVGAPGAVLDGQGINQSAFAGHASGVTVKYLTLQNFNSPTDEIAVNHDSGANWLIEYNLLRNNKGGAVATGSGGTITNNCLSHNDQYGFQGFGNNIALTNNDIAFNNPNGYYDVPGSTIQCGCSGGGKFWQATNATVTGNYVHDNNGVGLWVDTDNAGFNISGNYVSNNWKEGIMYEASYNAQITNNRLVHNATGMGSAQTTPGFPDGAIYVSESGGDSRVASNYSGQFLISGNIFTDNWGGVVLWENANRYCSDGSDAVCTLVNPSVYTVTSCGANLSQTSPIDYYDNCRWKTQNVLVENNTFNFIPANVANNCNLSTMCGFVGLFSDYGISIYGNTRIVAVTFQQNNVFQDNTYNGSWSFFAWAQSNIDNPVTWTEWRAAVTDQCDTSTELASGTCNSGFGQDSGSTLKA